MRNKFLPVLALSLFATYQSKAQIVMGITGKIADIESGMTHGSYPLYFGGYNNDILFSAVQSASGGRELWKTDGTTAGTQQVKDLNPGIGFSSPRRFTMLNGNAYFVCTDGTSILLWKTDATPAGTTQVSGVDLLDEIFPYNNSLLFCANGGIEGYELWKSDGTASGTQLVADLYTGSGDANPTSFTALDTRVLFAALADGVHYSPCITDGTTSGTASLAPINVYVANSAYEFTGKQTGNFCVYNGEAYFGASDGVTGFELWKTDGTPSGTVMVKDIAPAADASMPNSFKVFNGKLYFSVNTGNPAIDGLWVSSGTTATTARLKNGITMGDGSVTEYAEMNGKLYFIASNKVWTTDGTVSGTHSLLNSPATPHRLSAMNGKLYCFGIDNITSTFTLFQIDNTENVIPVSFPMSSSSVNLLHTYATGKYLYFGIAPSTDVNDVELYRFKDTVFTVGVPEIATQSSSIYPNPATNSFSVQVPDSKNTMVYVYSLNGQLLLQSAKTDNIDITKLPPGIYTVQIISDGAVSVGKLRKE